MSSDNHPIIQPLSLLNWTWDTSVSPPIKRFLVQWPALTPKDTTWED